MHGMIGTLTTKHGLAHAVREKRMEGGLYTVCHRLYQKSVLVEPGDVVTCVFCVLGKAWPIGMSTADYP